VITLTLLHPVQSTPVQSWNFENEPVIRIGRAVDNHVVLYSAVVSRHHVELRRTGLLWEVVNLGTNGTYLDGKRVHQAPLTDGGVIRLARSGPNIQVRFSVAQGLATVARTVGVSSTSDTQDMSVSAPPIETKGWIEPQEQPAIELNGEADAVDAVDVDKPQEESDDDEEDHSSEDDSFYVSGQLPPAFQVANGHQSQVESVVEPSSVMVAECSHPRATPELLFCIDCGQPLKVIETIGKYQVLKPLGESNNTFVAWRDGYTLVLKTIAPELVGRAKALSLFKQQVKDLCQLNHLGLPKVLEGFSVENQPFLVTELIQGQSLRRQVAKQGVLPQQQAIAHILQICQTLDYLHQQPSPLVHQHVKPGNLICPIHPRGEYRVVLVGLGDVTLLTPEVGTFTNAISYTAPEQQEGHPVPASDLYSLGTTLVYLLTGQEPDVFYRWGNQDFRLYVEDIPNLSPEVAELIHNLTHPEPSARISSASALTERLQQLYGVS
jgi:eukaryotic-like serine/threonine-protein kinase